MRDGITHTADVLVIGARFADRIMITELLRDVETVCGAVGSRIESGEADVFKAKAVVMAGGRVRRKTISFTILPILSLSAHPR